MNTKTLAWTETIDCEGGPVLVANLEDFRHWHGAEPFHPSKATELHYWSPFTYELPEQWHPNGPNGHQYLASANPSAVREELMSLILDRWPGTTVDQSEPTWRAIRPDGRILNAALSPGSEYDSAIRKLDAEGIHNFGDGAAGYLWSAAPGEVRINVGEKRDFLLLSQVEFCDDEADAQKAYAFALAAAEPEVSHALQYRVTSGAVMVAWSPNSVRDLSHPIEEPDTLSSSQGILLDLATRHSGALLWLEPGLYESSLQYHEEGSWAVSWYRLQRVEDGNGRSSSAE
jgi:hypothetical protein